MCPSDRSSQVPLVGASGNAIREEQAYVSWQYNGGSYPINWYWMEYFVANGHANGSDYDLDLPDRGRMPFFGKKMLARKVGGPASRFAIFYENAMNAFMYEARPNASSTLNRIRGWHRRFSKYSIAFLDGSARHMYIDTRATEDRESAQWTTWPERKTMPIAGTSFDAYP